MKVVPPDKQELVDTQGYLQVDDFGYTLSHKDTSHGLKEKWQVLFLRRHSDWWSQYRKCVWTEVFPHQSDLWLQPWWAMCKMMFVFQLKETLFDQIWLLINLTAEESLDVYVWIMLYLFYIAVFHQNLMI